VELFRYSIGVQWWSYFIGALDLRLFVRSSFLSPSSPLRGENRGEGGFLVPDLPRMDLREQT
jgi:hypothetical protein